MIFVLIACLAWVSQVMGTWEAYIKPCEEKICSSIPGVDFVYMINLDERPEKYHHVMNELQPFFIVPYRFPAINGWNMDREVLDQLGCPHLHAGTTPGKVGCVLSHLSVLQDAYDSGYQTIWVMEDDIEVVENPLQLTSLIEALDGKVADWDILYTDPMAKDFYGNRVDCLAICPRPSIALQPLEFYLRRIPVDETFLEVGMRYGTYSMIIRRSGIEKILSYFREHDLFLPIDMELFFVPGLTQIVIQRDIVANQIWIKSDTTYCHFMYNES